MANYNEIAGLSISEGGADMACKNYGGGDIPAGSGVLMDTTNLVGPNLPVGIVLPTAAGGVVGTLGITVEDIPAGKIGRVRMYGGYPMIADGAITAGTAVQVSDTASKMGRVKAKGAGVIQLGQACGTAADGDPVLVIVHISQCA